MNHAQEKISDLVAYAESAVKEGFPFEVKGEDLTYVLAALKALDTHHRPSERVCQCATYCMANAGMKWYATVRCRGLMGTDPGMHLRLSGEPIAPCMVDGVRHRPNCACLHTPAFEVVRRPCDCGAQKSSGDSLIVSAEEAKNNPLAFRHWSKDPLVPYAGCHCGTCSERT